MMLSKGRQMTGAQFARIYFSSSLTIRSEFICITEALAAAALLDYLYCRQTEIGIDEWICDPPKKIRAETHLSEGELRFAMTELIEDGLVIERAARRRGVRELKIDTDRVADKVVGGS